MEHPVIVEKYMNQYPVIFLSLKGISGDTFAGAEERLRRLIAKFCDQNSYLVKDDRFSDTIPHLK